MMQDPFFNKYPDTIPGIYNYCDRWCERCSFRERCGSFIFGEKLQALMNENLSDGNCQEVHVHAGIHMDPVPFDIGMDADDADDRERLRIRKNKVTEHALVKSARHYCDAIHDIIRLRTKTGSLEGIALDEELAAQLESAGGPDLFRILCEKHEAILRFSSAIYVKLRRAVDNWFEILDEGDPGGVAAGDMNGTAKLVLVMADEMIEEWIRLRETPDGFAGEINNLFDALLNIREMTEAMFPEARAFVRAGLDG